MRKRKYGLLTLLLASTACFAQTDSVKTVIEREKQHSALDSGQEQARQDVNKLRVGIDFLTHGEMCGGGLPRSADGSKSTEDRSSFLFGRFRLNVDYERPGLQAHATIQNKAVWGMSGNQALNLYEGWVKMTAKKGLFAQLGRVALAYDDERIIGPNDFATAAMSHDVLRVGYEGHGHKAHAILAYNQTGDQVYSGSYYDNGAQYYKTMHTLWYHYDVPKFPLGASLLFMNIGQQTGIQGSEAQPPKTEYQQMYGGYVNIHPKHLTVEGSYYRQTGKMANEYKQSAPIKAWLCSAKATVKPTNKYGFTLGYDYLSGDEYVPVIYGGTMGLPRHAENGGFAPLFGSRNKFYGIMDYFYASAYTQGFTPGLQNAYVGVLGKPAAKLDCSATYHYLAVATDLNGLNRTLGHSIELQAAYQFSKDIKLVAGYTQMRGTETMDRLKQGNTSKNARWGWFSLVVSPSIFTTRF